MHTRAIFLVDDSAQIRERLQSLIARIDGVSVVGEAETPTDAVEGIRRTRPHCVILDIQLKDGTGIEVLRTLRAEIPELVFVVFTNHAAPQYRRLYMDAGANSFLDKSQDIGRIKEILQSL